MLQMRFSRDINGLRTRPRCPVSSGEASPAAMRRAGLEKDRGGVAGGRKTGGWAIFRPPSSLARRILEHLNLRENVAFKATWDGMMAQESDGDGGGWRLEHAVPVTMLVALAAQVVWFVAWAAKIDERVMQLEVEQVAHERRLGEMDDKGTRRLGIIEDRQDGILRRLDEMERGGPRER